MLIGTPDPTSLMTIDGIDACSAVCRGCSSSRSAALVGHADEGFWLFNRIPKAAIKQALGVDLSDAWLQRVQQAVGPIPRRIGIVRVP